ncbi:MAG: hypothetical protein HFH38_15690 [Lachnospiraceae bacterium]|jgi:hypothetical protein|nr:hypothetical protein [Lachnospiraceae bacterium]
MERDVIVLYILAGVLFSFALFNGIFFVIKRGKAMKTNGTVVSITYSNPANERQRNAKLAKVSGVSI